MSAANRAELMQKLARSGQPATPAPAAPTRPNVPMVQPSTCVVLQNMFDPSSETDPNFDQEIKLDVEEEIERSIGKVKHIFVDKNSTVSSAYVRVPVRSRC